MTGDRGECRNKMASGGKRGAGERVLESKHVIGLFLLMLLFSGVFFTLGYVMGRNQYDGQVRAAAPSGSLSGRPVPCSAPRRDVAPKKATEAPQPDADVATRPLPLRNNSPLGILRAAASPRQARTRTWTRRPKLPRPRRHRQRL